MITYFYCSPFRCSIRLVIVEFVAWLVSCFYFFFVRNVATVHRTVPRLMFCSLLFFYNWIVAIYRRFNLSARADTACCHVVLAISIRPTHLYYSHHSFIHLIPWFDMQLSDTHLMTHLHHSFIYSFIYSNLSSYQYDSIHDYCYLIYYFCYLTYYYRYYYSYSSLTTYSYSCLSDGC